MIGTTVDTAQVRGPITGLSIDDCRRAVQVRYRVRKADLLGRELTRRFTRPRQIAMVLAWELTTYSGPAIGRHFGGRDHTTIFHARVAIAKREKKDAQLLADMCELRLALAVFGLQKAVATP